MANSPICSVDDCCKSANGKRGMCNAHYLRWWRHGSPTGGKNMVPAQKRVGEKFGRLTVLELAPRGPNERVRAVVQCDCGDISEKELALVVTGHSISCGCYSREVLIDRNTSHGMSGTSEHNIWMGMRGRCSNEKNHAFSLYGGRGIRVCERWSGESGFENFIADMGLRPSNLHSLDRIDVNGNYEPGNVRWATKTVQANNTRRNVKIAWDGRTMSATEWSEITGINRGTIIFRIKNGWPIDRALTQPSRIKLGRKAA